MATMILHSIALKVNDVVYNKIMQIMFRAEHIVMNMICRGSWKFTKVKTGIKRKNADIRLKMCKEYKL